MEKTLKPALRFKGFTDTWEQRELRELGSVAMNKRIFKDQTTVSGDVPFYKIGTFGSSPDAYITRNLFEEYKSKYSYPEIGDILISASGSIGRTVEYKGKDEYFQDSNIVWLKHNDEVENIFLKHFYSVVKWSGLEGSTIQRLYNKNILDTHIKLPDIEEQKRVGGFLDNLDNLITLHQRKYDKLNNFKKALLDKMFPKNGELVPQLRFKGFTDTWEQCELKDLIRKPVTDGPHETPTYVDQGIPFLSVEAIHDGILDLSKNRGYISEIDNELYNRKYKPEINDVLITKAATIGRVAMVETDSIFNIWSPIGAIKVNESILVPRFLLYHLQLESIQKEAINASNNGSQLNLGMKKIEQFSIKHPIVLQEQESIASLFKNIDNVITLHQRKYEKLLNIKKALLQKMFV